MGGVAKEEQIVDSQLRVHCAQARADFGIDVFQVNVTLPHDPYETQVMV